MQGTERSVFVSWCGACGLCAGGMQGTVQYNAEAAGQMTVSDICTKLVRRRRDPYQLFVEVNREVSLKRAGLKSVGRRVHRSCRQKSRACVVLRSSSCTS